MIKILKKSSILLGLAFILLSVSNCVHHPGGIAASSTPIEGRKYHNFGPASGTDRVIYILGIPVTCSNSLQAARDKAINFKNGDALINVTAVGYLHFYVVFWTYTTSVHGDVIKFKDGGH
jgi:hypothetical protein